MHKMKYYSLRILPYAVACLILVLILPTEGSLLYEYKTGHPWTYESLYAPFDFPVQKSEKALEDEKRHILEDQWPYYTLTELSVETAMARIRSYYKQIPSADSVEWEATGRMVLHKIYAKGVRNMEHGFLKDSLHTPTYLVILNGSEAEQVPQEETYTEAEAGAYFHETMARKFAWMRENGLTQLPPNLIFNERLTVKMREEQLSNISPTQGMVALGEPILRKGEIVSERSNMILESLRKEYQQRIGFTGREGMQRLGIFIFVFCILTCLYIFLFKFRNAVVMDIKKSSFILLLMILMVGLTILLSRSESKLSIYIIPFVIVPIYIDTFFDSRLATFSNIAIILLLGFFVPNGFEFCLLNLVVGTVAIYSMKDAHRRGRLFSMALLIFLSYSVMYFGTSLVKTGSIESMSWLDFVWFGINALLVIFGYQLIYLFEKMFGFLSDSTLVELSDYNHPLLRELAEKAPSTFQHVLQVANLAESATRKVGGNPLLARAGALYHDIGKMKNPTYFIENILDSDNPHKQLTPEQSAGIIIAHVPEGVAIARKHRIPQDIIDFIQTHHGTSYVGYFLNEYRRLNPNTGDISHFRYPGPKPMTKEQGILMMADAIEASSRSMGQPSEKGINELVENIINYQINQQQHNNLPLSLKEITIIKQVFKQKLVNIYHDRIVE